MVAAAIGQVLDSDVFACKETGERFIKVRAVIDFAKPLRSQLWAPSDEVDCFWVNLKYEFLPSFCYHCGRVGHARRECSFDPPKGKERFGPHMSTRKLGRKIYDEETDTMRSRGQRQTVWVNRQINGPTHNGRTYVGGRDEMKPVVVKKPEVAPRNDAMGGTIHNNKSTQDQGLRAHPSKSTSPRGFPVTKPPRLQLARGRNSRKLGQLGNKSETGGRDGEGDERRGLGVSCEDPLELIDDSTGIIAATRRRRLILESDSDDDALTIDKPPPVTDLGPAGVQGSGSKAPLQDNWTSGVIGPVGEQVTGQGDGPVAGEKPTPGKGSAKKGRVGQKQHQARPPKKSNSRKAKGEGGRGGSRKGGPNGLKADQVGPMELGGAEGQPHGLAPKAELIKALVSENSDSEEDHQCFEIKRRGPSSKSNVLDAPAPGRVSQVVAAFEAGLIINSGASLSVQEELEEKFEVPGESAVLDEYGSNLVNQELGTRKRPLETVEGEMGDAPSPKKQFIEVDDNLEQVEEASLKWPQSNK
ncbi:unnamed protein product [Linum tenue]|uniref:CCHC-type domain-containing protein n=1 Tax=Linum tenue TaxID=586396 RepID=A0AAV0LNV7_9ROSI|nr:unnamed protein product [Linum tenue]